MGWAVALVVVGVGILFASTVNTTPCDFVLSGTQPGDVPAGFGPPMPVLGAMGI